MAQAAVNAEEEDEEDESRGAGEGGGIPLSAQKSVGGAAAAAPAMVASFEVRGSEVKNVRRESMNMSLPMLEEVLPFFSIPLLFH